MKSFKELLSEKKDHIIKRLKNLSGEEKDVLIDFFKKNPHAENQIDWNNKKLEFNDFKDVINSSSKRKKKKSLKDKGIGGLKEGEDYIHVKLKNKEYLAYAPLNYEASKAIATKHIGNCEGKWCVAYQKSRVYWQHYNYQGFNEGGASSIFVYIIGKGTKWAMDIKGHDYDVWDASDTQVIENGKMTSGVMRSRMVRRKTGNEIPVTPSKEVLDEIMTKKRLLDDIRKFKVDKKISFIEKAKTRNAEYGNTISGFSIPGVKPNQSDNVWFTGDWLSGTWHSGHFKGYDSVWYNGTWLSGSFEAGEWRNGIWKYGVWNKKQNQAEWKNGTWEGGIWYDGIWHNGLWKDGWWGDGLWNDGIWEDGRWKQGIHVDGQWNDGIWEGGTWEGGLWISGKWERGKWEGGVWKNGLWEYGLWKDGEWKNGEFIDGAWDDGIWYGGTWYKGIWKTGTWHGGEHRNGIWYDGEWLGGKWLDGIWRSGVWLDGIWVDGVWKGGVWEGGYDGKGYYHEEGDSPDKWDYEKIMNRKKKHIKR